MSSSRDSVLLAEAFKALSKAVKRKACESDSDDYIEQPTNRGNKLKKRARFVRQGQLGTPNGPAVYKETVDHAGYQRTIISRNPPLIDEEGYEIDSEDDQERVDEAQAEANEVNPYAGVRLEEILGPLTSTADLANHPTLSRPFLSTALEELSIQARNLMHKEGKTLWKVRPLLTRLCGDHTWAPCEMMLTSSDVELFEESNLSHRLGPSIRNQNQIPTGEAQKPVFLPKTNGVSSTPTVDRSANGTREGVSDAGKTTGQKQEKPSEGVTMGDANAEKNVVSAKFDPRTQENHASNGDKNHTHENGRDKDGAEHKNSIATIEESQKDPPNGQKQREPPPSADKHDAPDKSMPDKKDRVDSADSGPKPPASVDLENGKSAEVQPAGGAADNTPTDVGASRQMLTIRDASVEEQIHPFFVAPLSAHPDRDLGLPEQEAEDVRRLLQLYVQKQEEVCRGTKDLYEGLLRAVRLKKTVLKWSKAEAHCGANRDMSDGEDWYDKCEWGLTEDLKKGQDEEEEDTSRDQPKKTRNRR